MGKGGLCVCLHREGEGGCERKGCCRDRGWVGGDQMEDVQKRAVAPKKIDGRGLLSSSSHCKEPLGAFEGEHASQYF